MNIYKNYIKDFSIIFMCYLTNNMVNYTTHIHLKERFLRNAIYTLIQLSVLPLSPAKLNCTYSLLG